jgi:hypothetical protein
MPQTCNLCQTPLIGEFFIIIVKACTLFVVSTPTLRKELKKIPICARIDNEVLYTDKMSEKRYSYESEYPKEQDCRYQAETADHHRQYSVRDFGANFDYQLDLDHQKLCQ